MSSVPGKNHEAGLALGITFMVSKPVHKGQRGADRGVANSVAWDADLSEQPRDGGIEMRKGCASSWGQ